MHKRLLIPLLLAGCRVSDPGAPPDDSGLGAPPVCDEVVSGRWHASGSGFGMPMDTTLTFDPTTCEVLATDWEMNHTSQMWGAVIDGDAVTLFGSDSYWDSCTGTLADGTSITGICADHAVDGAFTLTLLE